MIVNISGSSIFGENPTIEERIIFFANENGHTVIREHNLRHRKLYLDEAKDHA